MNLHHKPSKTKLLIRTITREINIPETVAFDQIIGKFLQELSVKCYKLITNILFFDPTNSRKVGQIVMVPKPAKKSGITSDSSISNVVKGLQKVKG